MPTITETVRVVLEAIDGDHVVVAVPDTSYRLRLACAEASTLNDRIGRRVRGRIEGRALRMHATNAGGRFIEPSEGTPRIVQGSVQAVERSDDGTGISRILVDMAVPVWISPMPGQCFEEIALGALVNFYMESGTRFVPDER